MSATRTNARLLQPEKQDQVASIDQKRPGFIIRPHVTLIEPPTAAGFARATP